MKRSKATAAYAAAREALDTAEGEIKRAIEEMDAQGRTHAWGDRLAEVQDARRALEWGRVSSGQDDAVAAVGWGW